MRRRVDDRVRLLHGPYHAPALRVGDRATCLFKDCDVHITGWTNAPLSWPRCLPVGRKGHPSLLVDEELARAVRTESAAALGFWWGVSEGVVWRWRKALGVGRMDNPGSRRLILAASEKGGEAVRGVGWSPEQRARQRQTALDLNLGRNLKPGYNLGPWWTEQEAALLGRFPDADVARRTRRTAEAVRSKRQLLQIPNPTARPGGYGRPPWSDAEDDVLQRLPPGEVAAQLGRTLDAVYGRRSVLRRRT